MKCVCKFFEAVEMKPIHQFSHFLVLLANNKICTHSPCMFWYKPRLINGIVICQTHILDIDMNRNYHLSDSYIRHGHESKGGGSYIFLTPREGESEFF